MKASKNYIIQFLCSILLFVAFGDTSYGQNNGIFTGGAADGFFESSYMQASSNLIFKGGNADGFGQTSILQPTNNNFFAGGNADGFAQDFFLAPSQNAIFEGAVGDGFDASSFAQLASNAVFAGGNADGFSLSSFIAPSQNEIFTGGNADGYDQGSFTMASNNVIFAGGIADGFVESGFFQPTGNLIFMGGNADGFDVATYLHFPVLPIKLLSFTGRYDAGDALLNWMTTTEINNSHFILERSFDAVSFEPVARIRGAGTSYGIHNYNYTDPVAHLANQYTELFYRLKQVDYNADFTYSNTVRVRLEAGEIFVRAFPNPTSGRLSIQFRTPIKESILVKLYDLQGKTIKVYPFAPQLGRTLLQLDLGNLSQGTYVCSVEYVDRISKNATFKIIIQR